MNKKYEGWNNYETWCVNLWLGSEQGTYNMVLEMTQQAKDAVELADMIKDFVDENAPDLGATMWADLMKSAMDEVDYYEIAEVLINERKIDENAG